MTTALEWLCQIRLTLIARKVRVSETVRYDLSEAGLKAAQRARPGVVERDVTPEGELTRELANASRKGQRYLRRLGLRREDREDILGAALLWCWENRNNYSLTTSLATWFVNAVRNAFQAWGRDEKRSEQASSLALNPEPALVWPDWAQLLTTDEFDILQMHYVGLTRQDMMRRGISEWAIRKARKRFKQLRG